MVRYAAFKDNSRLAGFGYEDNPAFRDNPELFGAPQLIQTHTTTANDGSFSLIVLPGRALLGASISDGPYRLADFEEARKDPYFWNKTVPFLGSAEEFQVLKIFQVPENTETATYDLVVDPGQSLEGSVVGPDGKPVSGVRVTGLSPMAFQSTDPLKSSAFRVTGLAPGHPRLLNFYHPKHHWGVVLQVRAGDPGPLTVRLQPCGILTGRLVNAEGKPRPRVVVQALLTRGALPNAEGSGRELSATSDDRGCFRIEGLVPAAKYDLFTLEPFSMLSPLAKALSLGTGEAKELGDLPAIPPRP